MARLLPSAEPSAPDATWPTPAIRVNLWLMTDDLGDTWDDPDEPTPGEAAAAQERSFWEARRQYQELDHDDETGRRERRRLSKRSRRMNLRVRTHRQARRTDDGPVPRDLSLPPVPDREDFSAPGDGEWD